MAGRPRIYESVEAMEDSIYDYFHPLVKSTTEETACGVLTVELSEDKQYRVVNKQPTVTGLALHLGFADKTTLYEYRDRPEFSYSIKRALTMIEQYHEEGLSGNNVTGTIFALKNMGWKDKQETEHSGEVGIKQITGMQVK
jgi:hypothetical protein